MFTTIVNLINFSNFEIEILIYLNVKYKKLNVYVNVKFNSMFRVGNPGHIQRLPVWIVSEIQGNIF